MTCSKSFDDRHGRGSTILTGQLPVDHWHEEIVDPTIADAILDRRRPVALHRRNRGTGAGRRRCTGGGEGVICWG
jgi:hypothetical protein